MSVFVNWEFIVFASRHKGEAEGTAQYCCQQYNTSWCCHAVATQLY